MFFLSLFVSQTRWIYCLFLNKILIIFPSCFFHNSKKCKWSLYDMIIILHWNLLYKDTFFGYFKQHRCMLHNNTRNCCWCLIGNLGTPSNQPAQLGKTWCLLFMIIIQEKTFIFKKTHTDMQEKFSFQSAMHKHIF